jgi:hypothetical protein
MGKSDKKEKKREVEQVDSTHDVEVPSGDEQKVIIFLSSFSLHFIYASVVTQEIEERQGPCRHSLGRLVAHCTTSGSEKAFEKAAQDDKKRCIQLLSYHSWFFMLFLASRARQVKRGVKEVVKGIRKGEKGYVING